MNIRIKQNKNKMVIGFVRRILQRRHFWRYASFSEVAEIYASRMLRMMATSLVGGFSSVYLYQQGYSLQVIALFWAAFYGFKVLMSLPLALIVARFGPKKSTLIANISSIPAMIAIALVPAYGAVFIGIWAVFNALSLSLSNISHLVSFSKVKSSSNAGKEISFLNMFEKIMMGISPLIGGGIALIAGPEATMVTSALLYAVAAVPLFLSEDAVRPGQKISFRGFPWRTTWRVLRAEIGVGFEIFTLGIVWPLFITITVIGFATNSTYVVLGGLTSLSLVSSIISARVFGKIVDNKRGGDLLKYSVIGKMSMNFLRPTATTVAGVGVVNILSEISTTGQQIAHMRGIFDVADNSGKRIAFISLVDMTANFGAVLGALVFSAIIAFIPQEELMFHAHFYIAAVMFSLVAFSRFGLYRK